MHVQFGGEVAKRVSPLIVNLFAIGFVLLVWAAAAYVIDLIVRGI